MVLTLVGSSLSPCTKRVAVILHEKNVPFKFTEIDFSKHEQRSPANLEKQPFGKVPYIDDDGFVLYESRAIARYIAEKYADQGTPLIPTDLKSKALFEQAAAVEQANYDPYASKAVFEVMVKPFMGLTTDKEAFNAVVKQLETNLDVYDKILSKQKYLAGDAITLADFFHVPHAELLPAVGVQAMLTRPNVARWLKDVTERESWKSVKDVIKATA